MIGDAVDDVGQPSGGVHAAKLGGFDQGVDDCGAFAACIGPHEQIVFAPHRDGAQGSFGGTIVDLYPAVVDVAGKRGPAFEALAEHAGELTAGGQPGALLVEPGAQLVSGPRSEAVIITEEFSTARLPLECGSERICCFSRCCRECRQRRLRGQWLHRHAGTQTCKIVHQL